MRTRKVYIPIVLGLALTIGFLALRSDVVDDPVKIYKAAEVSKSTAQPPTKEPAGDTSQGGHFHADGTFHAEPHVEAEKKDGHFHADGTWHSNKDSDIQPESLIMPNGETITNPDKIATILEQEKRLLKQASEMLGEYDQYQVEYQKYIVDLKAYYRKRQELSDAWQAAQSDFDALVPEEDPKAFAEYVSRLSESEGKILVSEMQRTNKNVEQAWKRLRDFRTTRPIPPELPEISN